MTSPDDANPYPYDMPVWVKFPRSKTEEQGDRAVWPRPAGVIEQRVGEDEWQVCVEDMAVAALEDGPVGSARRRAVREQPDRSGS